MAGIVFVRTSDLAGITAFYIERVGMRRWLAQPEIEILQHENLLVGFHQSDTADVDSLLTFFYPEREQVDAMYERFRSAALTEPQVNARYEIYNFFARDPDGRRIEFQSFLASVPGLPAVPPGGSSR